MLTENNFFLFVSGRYLKCAKSNSTETVEGLERLMLSKRLLILAELLLFSDHQFNN